MIDRLKKYLSDAELPDTEVEQLTQVLLHAKEDYTLKRKWEATLAQQSLGQKAETGARNKILVLVLLLALIAAGYFIFGPKEEIPPMQYALNYIDTKTYPVNQSRGVSNHDITLIKAAEAYQKEDYKTAINYYESLLEESALGEDGQFYLGLSLLKDGANQKSLAIFQNIEKNKGSDFQFNTELKFFLALNYTLLEENEKALTYLKQLQESNWEKATILELTKKLEQN